MVYAEWSTVNVCTFRMITEEQLDFLKSEHKLDFFYSSFRL